MLRFRLPFLFAALVSTACAHGHGLRPGELRTKLVLEPHRAFVRVDVPERSWLLLFDVSERDRTRLVGSVAWGDTIGPGEVEVEVGRLSGPWNPGPISGARLVDAFDSEGRLRTVFHSVDEMPGSGWYIYRPRRVVVLLASRAVSREEALAIAEFADDGATSDRRRDALVSELRSRGVQVRWAHVEVPPLR